MKRLSFAFLAIAVFAMSSMAFAGWSLPTNLGAPLNSEDHETGVFVSNDGTFMLLAGDLPGCLGVTDIYISYNSGSGWGPPIHLGPEVNTSAKENEPYLNADETVLYFVSERSGGMGGADVWAISWDNGPVGQAVNLGPAVNSCYGEYTVAISPDGSELWFSSTRPEGLGGADMYVSHLQAGFWQPAENIGTPLNSPADDGGMAFTADGSTLVLVRHDAGGFGSYDLMIAEKLDGVWQAPVNMGCGVNSELVDWSPHITADGSQVYYTPYGLGGGLGESDIWVTNHIPGEPTCGKILVVHPSSLSFGGFVGSTATQSGVLALTSKGGMPIDFAISDDAAWLTVVPVSGTTPTQLDVTVDPSGLAAGEHAGIILITSPDPEVMPIEVSVVLSLQEPSVCTGWQQGYPLGYPINSPGNETKPFWTDNDQTLYFASADRPEGLGNYDIYVSRWDGNGWSTPENLGPAINSAYHDDNPQVSADGNRMVFISRRDGYSHVWMSEKVNGVWQQAVKLGPEVNTSNNEWTVGINPAGDEIIYSSARSGGYGAADMYLSHWVNGAWTQGVLLPQPFNSNRDDGAVCYSKDNSLIYFVSWRDGGYGGHDLYVSENLGNGQFGIPQNLGCGVNTPDHETYPAIGADNRRLIYAGLGLPGAGGSDLYMSYFDTTTVGADEIYVFPPVIQFSAIENGANPAPKSLTISAAQGSTHDFSISISQPWLTVDPLTGNTPALVTLSADITGLAEGYYRDTLWVNSTSATNVPKAIPVVLVVSDDGTTPTESEDTVRVAQVMSGPGQNVEVVVELYSRVNVQGYTLPLHFDTDALYLNSVTFDGTASAELDPPLANINNETGTVLFGGICMGAPYIAAGESILAKLNFTISENAADGSYPILTEFIPPAGSYTFVMNGYDTQPVFKPGSVTVSSAYKGDADGNGIISISDAVGLINIIFGGQQLPMDAYRLDANCSNNVNITDCVYLVNYIFAGGSAPCNLFSISKRVIRDEAVDFTMRVASTSDGTVNVVVESDANQGLAATQLSVKFDSAILELVSFEPAQDLTGMEFFHSESASELKLGLIDMDGRATLPAGKVAQYVVEFHAREDFDAARAIQLDGVVASSLSGFDLATSYKVQSVGRGLPKEFNLGTNYPNPFNPTTVIEFGIPKSERVTLEVFNVLGQRVKTLATKEYQAGFYRVTWDGTDNTGTPVASGVYFYRLQAGQFTESKTMMLLK